MNRYLHFFTKDFFNGCATKKITIAFNKITKIIMIDILQSFIAYYDMDRIFSSKGIHTNNNYSTEDIFSSTDFSGARFAFV